MNTTSSPTLPDRLSRVHTWVRAQPWLGRFTLLNRVLLAIAFLPTGLVKVTGQRFTLLPVSDPVGFFFEAMYRTGPYWIFIGLVQVVGAIAIVIPQTALVGAILLLPVVVSILLITWGIGFTGTVWIAVGMLLSVVYLLCWDADRVWRATAVVVGASSAPPIRGRVHALERLGWWPGGASGLALLLVARGLFPRTLTRELFYAGIVAFALIAIGWILTLVASKR